MMKVWYNDDGDVMLSIKDNDKYEEIIKYFKFISFIFRVYYENEVNDYIDKIKKEYINDIHAA